MEINDQKVYQEHQEQQSQEVMNPPPSYQMDHIESIPVVTQQPTTTIMQSPVVGHNPTIMTCPCCRATIRTTVSHQITNDTCTWACVLCIFGCWPFCLYPFCMDACKKANHKCPNCKSFVGSHNSFTNRNSL